MHIRMDIRYYIRLCHKHNKTTNQTKLRKTHSGVTAATNRDPQSYYTYIWFVILIHEHCSELHFGSPPPL